MAFLFSIAEGTGLSEAYGLLLRGIVVAGVFIIHPVAAGVGRLKTKALIYPFSRLPGWLGAFDPAPAPAMPSINQSLIIAFAFVVLISMGATGTLRPLSRALGPSARIGR